MNYISLLCNFFRLWANTQKAELKSYIYRKKAAYIAPICLESFKLVPPPL